MKKGILWAALPLLIISMVYGGERIHDFRLKNQPGAVPVRKRYPN